MIHKKILIFAAAFFSFLIPLSSFAQTVDSGFNPSLLIDDKVFSDTKTFGGPEGIQNFLESKGSVLANTSSDFLVKLKEPQAVLLKEGLEDPQPKLGRLRTAAEIIWDAAQSTGLNPQVIIVTLNKEQSLITGHQNSTPEVLQKALDRAMGFACPDSGGCGDLFPGFYYQIFGNFDSEGNRYLGAAKSLMKSFTTPGGRGPSVNGAPAKVGQVLGIANTQGPPYNAQAEQQVTMGNAATAALYRYTPHVFNGNYNFWRFFQMWFRYANGTLVKLKGKDPKVYVIQNGTRQLVVPFVAQARNLTLGSAITVSQNEIESYPVEKPYTPADNTIVKIEGSDQPYVFFNGERRPASAFVLSQRGLNVANAITVSKSDVEPFPQGAQLTPSDGTVVRGEKDTAVYLITGGKLKAYSAFTFGQHKAASKLQVIPDTEIASLPKDGFVAPLDGTVIKAANSPAVYLVANGLRLPMTFEVFKNRAIRPGDVAVLGQGELDGLPQDGFATPADRTWFTVAGTTDLYLFKEGTRHRIFPSVAKQRGITPDFTFSGAEVASWQEGIPVSPRDNTLVKGDKDGTVYVVLAGQLRPLTGEAFAARRYSFTNVQVYPQAEVDAFAKGDILTR